MRTALTLSLAITPTFSHAHIGHIGEIAGHGHWIGLGAIALAGLLGWIGAKSSESEPEEQEPEEETA